MKKIIWLLLILISFKQVFSQEKEVLLKISKQIENIESKVKCLGCPVKYVAPRKIKCSTCDSLHRIILAIEMLSGRINNTVYLGNKFVPYDSILSSINKKIIEIDDKITASNSIIKTLYSESEEWYSWKEFFKFLGETLAEKGIDKVWELIKKPAEFASTVENIAEKYAKQSGENIPTQIFKGEGFDSLRKNRICSCKTNIKIDTLENKIETLNKDIQDSLKKNEETNSMNKFLLVFLVIAISFLSYGIWRQILNNNKIVSKDIP